MIRPNSRLVDTLLPAFGPCSQFGSCRQALWDPASGHLPRGFLGAVNDRTDVELVMVFKEPGHPYSSQYFDRHLTGLDAMDAVLAHTYDAMANSNDQFHRNVRWFLSQLYPSMTFTEQLKHVWLTEGRLCSVEREIDGIQDRRCADIYLRTQLELLPHATIVGFGIPAQKYLDFLGFEHIKARALSPPGCNHKPAKPSWTAAIEVIKERRNAR